MKIGIDIDDTISDTYEIQFNLAQYYTIHTLKRSPKIRKLDNLKTHFYTAYLHNWSEEETKFFFTQFYLKCLEDPKPKMFARDVIKQLKEDENKIYLITARFDCGEIKAKDVTQKWMKKYDIPYDELIVDAQEKGKIAREYQLDMFLDDSYENCEKIMKMGIKTYLMDSRVNRGIEEREGIERIYSWPHFYQRIKEETRWNFTN